MTNHVRTAVVETPLDAAAITANIENPRCGAVVTFCGVVRNHDAGLDVIAIDYSAHPSAGPIMKDIADRVVQDHGVHAIEAWHRVGRLTVGEVAMVVAAAAEHRAQAFAAVQSLVDEVKTSVPVWKCQILSDDSRRWSGL
ncbi:hypothetical protein HMPREF1531_02292 [Propionibacterium sp. oral taxon 192 str. F0372]|nr:molybdenum cofactor biosynthesis protein MoaE [Propionibacterium sp. oral taxon 192]EPH02974.1 hypothetical protein HMPREF1531_02292 [Propionibacterium sp. oral taxon 192 str. F0372]